MPYFGYQAISPVRDQITADAGTFSEGVRLGGIAGWRMIRFLSLNAGIAIDLGSQSTAPEGYRGSLSESQLTLCPLVHLGPDAVQLVAGPKLGLLLGSESSGNGSGGGPHAAWHGWTYGAELGVFVRVAPVMSLGVLVAIDVMQPSTRTCDGVPECPNTSYPPRHNVESALLALLF